MPDVEAAAIPHPKLRALFEYWDGKRNGRTFPARASIDPVELRSLLPNVLLVDVEHDPLRFRYRLVGTELTAVLGQELRGRYVDEMPVWFRKFAEAAYRQVVDARAPTYSDINTVENFWPVRYSRLLLPLSSDGAAIDVILGGLYRAK